MRRFTRGTSTTFELLVRIDVADSEDWSRVHSSLVFDELRDAMLRLFGLSAIVPEMICAEAETRTIVFECAAASVPQIRAAAAFVTKIQQRRPDRMRTRMGADDDESVLARLVVVKVRKRKRAE